MASAYDVILASAELPWQIVGHYLRKRRLRAERVKIDFTW
jgi:hypothetical protein